MQQGKARVHTCSSEIQYPLLKITLSECRGSQNRGFVVVVVAVVVNLILSGIFRPFLTRV
jgi:hypothetical protein